MLLSVVIPTRNRPISVVETVRSVFANSWQDFEIWVVDQSESDETKRACEEYARDSRFHYWHSMKRGAGSSRNIGIALSLGEIVALTDDDVTVNTDWLERIAAEFAADPELEFICGALTAPLYDRSSGYTPEFWPHDALTDWQMPFKVAGANMSMRRSLFDKIGGFDELSGPGASLTISDDGDIAFRMMRSGAKWKGCPEIEVVHTYGFRPAGPAEALKASYIDGVSANFGRYARRGDRRALLFYLARAVIQALRGLRGLACGQGTAELRAVGTGLRGFWRGFRHDPHEGVISGAHLREMRASLLAQLSEEATIPEEEHRAASQQNGNSYVRPGTHSHITSA